MKPLCILLCSMLLLSTYKTKAQSFTVAHDTVSLTISSSSTGLFMDSIINVASTSAEIAWKVVATNFPPDWLACSGFCDRVLCYDAPSLWPSGTSGHFPMVSAPDTANFYLSLDPACPSSTGCYFITVRLNNSVTTTDTATITYIICKPAPATAITATSKIGDVNLYPNPADNELNVVYSSAADIKTIAIYNIIGKAVNVYKTTVSTGAQLNLDHLSPGVYFIRLMNSRGDVVNTRKFTRQ